MKYELKTDNNFSNISDKVLENRNITNLEELKNPSIENVIDKYKLMNICVAVEKLIESISLGKTIGLIWDSDCDGYTSGALMHNYLVTRFPEIKLKDYFHTGKKHGISKDIKLDKDIEVLLVVDAGSNDYKQHEKLKSDNVEVIILDHHEAEKVSENAIVVNNQMSDNYPNKQLSGVGICYKFCKAIDDYCGETGDFTLADNYLDLVAIGNIGDMMDLTSLETRFYANFGIHNIHNKLLKALVKKQEFSVGDTLNFHKVSFYIVPLINALIREGKQSEKLLMAEALMDKDRFVPYKKRGATESIDVHIADECARMMANAKSRQDNKVKKAYEKLERKVFEDCLVEDKVIMIDVTDELENNFTGLVANKLLGTFKRPVILMQENPSKKGEFGGSARGFGIDDFKSICQESNLFTLAEGHANAFGIGFKKENVEKIREYFNEKFKDVVFSRKHIIDLEIKAKDLNPKDIIQVAQLEDIWSKDLSEPLFLIKDIHIKDNEIKLTDSRVKSAYFKLRNLSFKKPYANQVILDELQSKDFSKPHFKPRDLELRVIGKFKLNKVGSKEYPVIEIVDFESEEYEELIF